MNSINHTTSTLKMIKHLGAAALLAAIGATPALAGESHSERHCGWTRGGAYACSSTTDSDASKTSTLCVSGTYDTVCNTKTKLKEQPAPEPAYAPPSKEVVPLDAGAYERAKAREAESLKNGRTGIVVCGPDRWQKDHWEPSCK